MRPKVPPHPTGVPVRDAEEEIDTILTSVFRKQRSAREGVQEIARILNAAAQERRADIDAFLKAGG